jgi:hypothetical protein
MKRSRERNINMSFWGTVCTGKKYKFGLEIHSFCSPEKVLFQSKQASNSFRDGHYRDIQKTRI